MASSAATARGLVHARTLLGAIDDHEGFLVHNRPWMADERTEALEEMAAAWLEDGGDNWVPSLVAVPDWVVGYLDSLDDAHRVVHARAFLEFADWAHTEGLTTSQ